MFIQFLYTLRRYEIATGLGAVLDFYKGLRLGLAQDLTELYDLGSLCFVKRVRQMDAYERAFVYYFTGVDLPPVAEGDPELLHTRQFRDWLSQAIQKGELQPVTQNLSPAELMQKFWDTVREQSEEHHGGDRWIGTGGTSPFGHSGAAQDGIRVHGQSRNRSAFKVIGERRFINYSDDLMIHDAPMVRALENLKRLRPRGAATELDISESVYRSARNAGEIELVFNRPLRENHELLLFIDNGGASMLPYVDLTRQLFARIRNRFAHCETWYFHNTIYESVFRDPERRRLRKLQHVLRRYNDPMVIIIGDASMNPYELGAAWGSMDSRTACAQSSLFYLKAIRRQIKHTVWLNPIPAAYWQNTANWSLQKIRSVIHMEDLSLRGLRQAVDYLLAKELT